MMSSNNYELISASAAIQGARSYQEDYRGDWRPNASGIQRGNRRPILVVLSDGMGGHVSGEIASRLACTHYIRAFSSEHGPVDKRLEHSLIASNDALNNEIRKDGALSGMGCTIVSAYIDNEGIRWASVGDSILLLYRDGTLTRLNDDHSMGALLDKQVAAKIITKEEAKNNPRRRTLRSALTGGKIMLTDIEAEPKPLAHGDWLILASDGLETLSGPEIASIVSHCNDDNPQDLVDKLLSEVTDRKVDYQDNTTVVAVRVLDPTQTATQVVRADHGAPPIDIQDVPSAAASSANSMHLANAASALKSDSDGGVPSPKLPTLIVVGIIAAAAAVLFYSYVISPLGGDAANPPTDSAVTMPMPKPPAPSKAKSLSNKNPGPADQNSGDADNTTSTGANTKSEGGNPQPVSSPANVDEHGQEQLPWKNNDGTKRQAPGSNSRPKQ